jgi:hypothetical protein
MEFEYTFSQAMEMFSQGLQVGRKHCNMSYSMDTDGEGTAMRIHFGLSYSWSKHVTFSRADVLASDWIIYKA